MLPVKKKLTSFCNKVDGGYNFLVTRTRDTVNFKSTHSVNSFFAWKESFRFESGAGKALWCF